MQTQHTPPTPGSGPRLHTVLVIIATVTLILVSAFAVGLLIGERMKDAGDATNNGGTQDDETPPSTDTLTMVWNDVPLEVAPHEVFTTQWVTAYGEVNEFSDQANTFSAYNIGTVQGGQYDGYALVDHEVIVEGLGKFHVNYYLLVKEGEMPVVLERYGMSRAGFMPTGTAILMSEAHPQMHTSERFAFSDAVVAAFEREERVEDAEGNAFTLTGVGTYPEVSLLALEEQGAKVGDVDGAALYLWTSDLGEWTGAEQGFLLVGDDGRALWYDLVLPFWDEDAQGTSSVPEIAWMDSGRYNTETYLKGEVGGCGFISMTNVLDEAPVDIVGTGYAVNDADVIIYEPEDYTAAAYDDEYATYEVMHDGATREEFASIHPLFFYKDAFERWIQFTSTEVTPAGECGKPVIYLYPEETTDISVEVAPLGGFTKTEPAYGEGWRVTAHPDGRLVNSADGETYPYLFWEGRGGIYAAPSDYWVVPQEDVHEFLVDTLAELGLNEQETADFLEFWEPRMQAAPYYKIGFYGTMFMNAIAPLTLSTEPETLVRILMDYAPLTEPVPSHPPVLPATPEREGFTVIEWGGVIR